MTRWLIPSGLGRSLVGRNRLRVEAPRFWMGSQSFSRSMSLRRSALARTRVAA